MTKDEAMREEYRRYNERKNREMQQRACREPGCMDGYVPKMEHDPGYYDSREPDYKVCPRCGGTGENY